MSKFKVGDKIEFEGCTGTVCDLDNLDPKPDCDFNPSQIRDIRSSSLLVVLFNDDVFSDGSFKPYWLTDPRRCTVIKTAILDLDSLKLKNTQFDATICAVCNGKLNNPMPWLPKFKYCPKCEP